MKQSPGANRPNTLHAIGRHEGHEMPSAKPVPKTVDEYIEGFPEDVQVKLKKMRATILAAAPEAEETISYQIPTFKLHGTLVSFAAYKEHIGMYPAPEGPARFNRALSPYRSAKSTVRFPLGKPIPYDLVREIVELRVKDNLGKLKRRKGVGKSR
jgi:uncharacterized protein YdhG (YjbR/CyaY superfamily)